MIHTLNIDTLCSNFSSFLFIWPLCLTSFLWFSDCLQNCSFCHVFFSLICYKEITFNQCNTCTDLNVHQTGFTWRRTHFMKEWSRLKILSISKILSEEGQLCFVYWIIERCTCHLTFTLFSSWFISRHTCLFGEYHMTVTLHLWFIGQCQLVIVWVFEIRSVSIRKINYLLCMELL